MKKSISYWSFSGKNVFEAMRLAKDAGFDGIELTLDAEGDVTMETAPEKLAEIRRAAEEIGIALPSVASSLYWAYSFTSDDPEEREKAHQAAVCEIKTAKALGADTVLIVPGSVSVEFVPERPGCHACRSWTGRAAADHRGSWRRRYGSGRATAP